MTRWLAFVAVFLVGGAACAAPQVRQYSADMEVDAQGQRMTMRLYVDVGKTRTEMDLPVMVPGQAAMQLVTIARLDEGRVYLLYPADRVYEEKPLDQLDLQLASTMDAGGTGTLLGTETVDGQMCEKYEMSSKGGPVYVWTTEGQGLPVKLMPEDGSAVVRFRNVRPGPQPAALFELPAGYTPGSPMQGLMNSGLTGPASEDFSAAMDQMRKLLDQR